VKRDSVSCDANPGQLSGVSPAAELVARATRRIVAKPSWSRQPCAASSLAVRMSEPRSCVTSTWLKWIGQAGGHPADDAALLDDLSQEHRTGIADQSVNATFNAQRAVETHRDRK